MLNNFTDRMAISRCFREIFIKLRLFFAAMNQLKSLRTLLHLSSIDFRSLANYKVNIKLSKVRTFTGWAMAKLHVTVVQFRTQRMNTDRVRITEWFGVHSVLRLKL